MPTNRTPRGGKPRTDRPVRAELKRPGRAKPGASSGLAPERSRKGKPGEAKGRPESKGRPEYKGRSESPRRTETGRHHEAPRRERPTKPRFEEHAEQQEETTGRDIVFGRHPVLAALEGDQAINKVWILASLTNKELVAKVRQLAKEKGASVQMVERPKLDSLTLDANHQGLVASVAAATYVELEEVIEKALAQKYPALLLLDGIEDPHNLGALIRSAEGAGFAGVVIPNRRAVGLTPVVAKSSAGAVSRVPIARVGNLAQAAETLKKAGFWMVGADAAAEKLPYEVDLTQAIALVIGGEGKGLSRLLADRSDMLVKLPLGGDLESLNASVAGGVLMYEAVRQRWAKGS
ncbi:MAG TPA: 23S rRNA (guanosine(2251)-2'-O)-methyltransferase RlmB [Oscillatoriaceae cyanobacterium]